MKKNVRLLLVFIFSVITSFAILGQSCKSSQSASSNLNLEGTWVLKTFNGTSAKDAFKGTLPSMIFDTTQKRVFGSAGCNTYRGAYTLENGMLKVPNAISTLMACPYENKESEFLAMLSKGVNLSVQNGVLTLKEGSKVVATFEQGVETAMLGGEWVLESMPGTEMKSSFSEGKYPTINFRVAESKLGGTTGCNRYNASYQLEGTSINVGEAMMTKMACPNVSGEGKFAEAISGKSEISVSNEALVFSKSGKMVLKFVKKK